MFDCREGTEYQASALVLYEPAMGMPLLTSRPFPNRSKMQRACLQNPPIHLLQNIKRVYLPSLHLCFCISHLISYFSALQVYHATGWQPRLWTSSECAPLYLLSFLSAIHLDTVKQSFIISKCERMYKNGEVVAEVEGNAPLEIVGPQHLAAYLRAALIATPLVSTYRYHVTELLPMGSPIPPVCPLHPNEAPPTFLPPDEYGHYTVLESIL